LEVYVDCPIEALIDRDVKGFYMQALTGELANFSGVSDPYERPLDPEVYINTDVQSKQESLGAIVSKLKTTGWIPETDPAPVGALQPAILRILLALVFVASAIAANWTFEFNSGLWPFFVLAAAVAASTLLLGLAEGVASAGFAAIAADYLYVAPAFTFSLDSLSLRFALICLTLAAVTYWIGQRAQNRVRVWLS
jgi:hypothetical protein